MFFFEPLQLEKRGQCYFWVVGVKTIFFFRWNRWLRPRRYKSFSASGSLFWASFRLTRHYAFCYALRILIWKWCRTKSLEVLIQKTQFQIPCSRNPKFRYKFRVLGHKFDLLCLNAVFEKVWSGFIIKITRHSIIWDWYRSTLC